MMPPVTSAALRHKSLFLNDVEQSFQPWVPLLGPLQRMVMEGEYLPLGPLLPMFESDFLQVTNRGEVIFLHKKENPVTMGVASSIPGLLLPDFILLAQPVGDKSQQRLELTRLLPLRLVHLLVHNVASWRLKLCLASGRSFYLRLHADPREGCLLFNRWRYLVYLLQGPAPAWAPEASQAPETPEAPEVCEAPEAPEDSEAPKGPKAPKDPEEQIHCELELEDQKLFQADSTTMKAKLSRAISDSNAFMTLQLEREEEKKMDYKYHKKKKTPGICMKEEGQSSMIIWTLFSTVSNTLNRLKASKASTPMMLRSDLSRFEPCTVHPQMSSSWLGSSHPSEESFNYTDSSSTQFSSSSQVSTTWESDLPSSNLAQFKSPRISSNVRGSTCSQSTDIQHKDKSKTSISKSLVREFSKFPLKQTMDIRKSKDATELPHLWFSQQGDESLLTPKQSSPQPSSYPQKSLDSTKMSHFSTKVSFYPLPEASPDHFIKAPESSLKAPEPFPSTKTHGPSPSTKIPEPLPSMKLPKPSLSTNTPELSSSTKTVFSPSFMTPEYSPSTKSPEPSPSTKTHKTALSTKATKISPSTKTPKPSPSSKAAEIYPSTKIFKPSSSTKAPEISPFIKTFKPSPSTKAPEISPFIKTFKPFLSTKAPEISPTTRTFKPFPSTKNPEPHLHTSIKAIPAQPTEMLPYQSTKSSSKFSKRSPLHWLSKFSKKSLLSKTPHKHSRRP
ncbi:Golgi-associated RAB2 interactor protein 5B isoform X2 [Macrotis lagotis]|uniref:Golgi-associated RAB2 interactor protein 5B isoform X2 n=1 Tax=Macrotis lagotis TaxID=92651 RepID=UPI003D69CF4D